MFPPEIQPKKRSEPEERVLAAFLELPLKNQVLSLNDLSKYVFPDNPTLLQTVLQNMHEGNLIRMVQTEDGLRGVKLTLKGAVTALYGEWPFEGEGMMQHSPRDTLKTADRVAQVCPQSPNSTSCR
jgi:hypothetical protein